MGARMMTRAGSARKGLRGFAKRLQQAADYHGVGESQSKMANSLQMKRQAISRWHSGAGAASPQMLFKIARAWGVNPEWLASGKGSMHLTSDAPSTNGDEQELLETFRSAHAVDRSLILTMVKAAVLARKGTNKAS